MSRIEIDKEKLTAEMVFKEDDSAVIKIRQRLPDFLRSVKLKYVMLGSGYSYNFATVITFVLILPLSISTLVNLTSLKLNWLIELYLSQKRQLNIIHAATQVAVSTTLFFLFALFWSKRSRPVYLVDFCCYKPDDELKVPREKFLKLLEESGLYQEEPLQFMRRILTRACIGDETYLSRGLASSPQVITIDEARAETESVMFGALDSLFDKTGVNPSEIGILVVNCSLFSPVPSLSSMIVNHYKLRTDIKTYNLGGMGCSAGLISIDLANNLLKTNPNSYAIVVSTENITQNWYSGNDRSMLLCNCLFRLGASAMLLSNKARDRSHSKYELVHLVRTHTGSDDKHIKCAIQREDEVGITGISLSKELMAVAGEALKKNITTLGPLVLPWTEQFKFFVTLVRKMMFKSKVKPYIPDFKLAFQHFCIHTGGRAVLDAFQKNLQLDDWLMEPSRMTLQRFGNTSSSSLWYELAYTEGKGRVRKGDQIWQIGFGSGFKCNSAVWRALRDIQVGDWRGNSWVDSIDKYPVKLAVS